ncbi:MAG: DUF4982 domain-containing protein [Massilia sp.]
MFPSTPHPRLSQRAGERLLLLFAALLLALLVMTPAPANAAASPRAALNFNAGWRLVVGDPAGAKDAGFDDAAWKPVTLPHAWNEDAAFKVSIEDHPTGIAWYRKRFTLPAGSAGQKVFLEFEGARQGAQIYLNGKRVGLHENGVMGFGIDISEAALPAPAVNLLAVRTDNSWDYREELKNARYQWSDKNFNANYGGLPKNVKLHITNPVYQTLPLFSNLGTTGVYVYASDFNIAARKATVHAESEVRNDSKQSRSFLYKVSVADLDGRVVKTFDGGSTTIGAGQTKTVSAAAALDGLNFWSWGYGYLYTVTTSLEADGVAFDSVATRTGFRKTAFANGMVTLNDRVIQMKGYAQRTSNEWPAVGVSVPPWLSDYSNGLMVESGANLVRWMHVTPWKQDVESCDRVGLMQMMPAGDSEKDASGYAWEQRVALMRDAIIYMRNNPSILVYESGNKGVSEEHMREMKALRDKYDPHGGRAAGSREMLDSQVAEYGGEMLYVNKSARLPLWATEYSRDESLRKYWDDFSPPYHKNGDGPAYKGESAAVYNRNQDTFAIEDVQRWYDFWRERPGTGRRVSSGGVNIVFSDSNTHHRGAENYRRSGEVDAMRIPKDAFYAHKVMWDNWVDVERAAAFIVGHWNYKPGVKKDVTVVSSAEAVELFVNGKSLGRGKQSARFLFTFPNVAWEAGTLRAVAYDAKGAKVASDQRETAGEPVALRLTVSQAPGGLRADGADLALVQVEAVDAKGRRAPNALNMVDFTVNGPAEWRGGIAQGPDNYILARSLPVEGGVNRVLVRSTTTAGTISITARSAGLAPATLQLKSTPVAGSDGWSSWIAADALRPALSRGPTPAGPSYVVSRTSLTIVGASAGANADTAKQSYDDVETTAWSSGDVLENGWIEYQLERRSVVNEVALKLSGWRERSYPLRILVDGKEAWRGITPKSLGYVTLALKPTAGQKVRIELLGASASADAFNIKELLDQQNAANGAAKLSNKALSIVEAEIYEPVAAQ